MTLPWVRGLCLFLGDNEIVLNIFSTTFFLDEHRVNTNNVYFITDASSFFNFLYDTYDIFHTFLSTTTKMLFILAISSPIVVLVLPILALNIAPALGRLHFSNIVCINICKLYFLNIGVSF